MLLLKPFPCSPPQTLPMFSSSNPSDSPPANLSYILPTLSSVNSSYILIHKSISHSHLQTSSQNSSNILPLQTHPTFSPTSPCIVLPPKPFPHSPLQTHLFSPINRFNTLPHTLFTFSPTNPSIFSATNPSPILTKPFHILPSNFSHILHQRPFPCYLSQTLSLTNPSHILSFIPSKPFSLIDPSNTPPQTLPTFSPNTLPMFSLIKPSPNIPPQA